MLLAVSQMVTASATNYYVDSSTGADSNDGKSPQSAWSSLERVNAMTFVAGDTIHFVNGGEWRGILEPKGSGTEGNPIVITSYGESQKRPKINAEGREGKGVIYLENQCYWEISDLELTNPAATPGDRRGVWVTARNGAGVLSHIYLRNLYIHHIKGIVGQSRTAKRTSGIAFTSFGTDTENRFDDIWVDGCVIHDVDNQGIVTESDGGKLGYPQTQSWRNVRVTGGRVTNNLIFNISKNAMIIRLFEGGVVEHNLCYDTAIGTGEGMTGNTIFSAACDGTLFQFNEGYRNMSPHADGCFYDADLRSPNTVWQYSLSHNNNHGLFWACTTYNDTGVICRYNVSYNDKGNVFCVNYPVEEMEIYNNTVIVGEGLRPAIIVERGVGGPEPRNYTFKENVIYGGDDYFTYMLDDDLPYNRDVARNQYYGGDYITTPEDRHAQYGDIMKSAKALKGDVLFNKMGGAGAFAEGSALPEAFATMDFTNNFRIPSEHIFAGDELEIESDFVTKKRTAQVAIYTSEGEKIFDKEMSVSSKYSFGTPCTDRGLYTVEFVIGDRKIHKKLWVL